MRLATETRPQIKRDRIVRLAGVEHLTGLKKSTLYALMRRGEFVQAIRITPRCVGWSEAAVLQWVQDRIAGAVVGESSREGVQQ